MRKTCKYIVTGVDTVPFLALIGLYGMSIVSVAGGVIVVKLMAANPLVSFHQDTLRQGFYRNISESDKFLCFKGLSGYKTYTFKTFTFIIFKALMQIYKASTFCNYRNVGIINTLKHGGI